MIGDKIPADRLCTNQLKYIDLTKPNGKTTRAPFKMFNFMRDTFDDWLNKLAVSYGAEFIDDCSCTDFEQDKDRYEVNTTNFMDLVSSVFYDSLLV